MMLWIFLLGFLLGSTYVHIEGDNNQININKSLVELALEAPRIEIDK